MKNVILLIIGFLFLSSSIAQTMAIKMTKLKNNKEVIIKENKRIQLVTTNGNKIRGTLLIEDDQTISVDGNSINLSDINSLKRNSLFLSILTSSALIYAGAVTIGFGAIIGVFADSSGFLLAIPGAALITAGILSPNLHKNHKKDKGWSFEIVTLTN